MLVVINLYAVAVLIAGLCSRVSGNSHGCHGPGCVVSTLTETCTEDVQTLQEQFLQLKQDCAEKQQAIEDHISEAEDSFSELKDLIVNVSTTPGPAGPKGEMGEQGYEGDNGSVGVKGQKGLIGDKGVDGNPGAKGEKGSIGSKGLEGDQGMEGDQGPKGELGDPGDKGMMGPKGDMGSPGAKGETGDAGPPGTNGDKGVEGDKGAEGEKGMMGSEGIRGDIGPDGMQGQKGEKGETGLKGEKGDQGPIGNIGEIGDQGDKGIQGIKGIKGQNGATGETGSKGDIGDRGTKGETGEMGETGDKGDEGEQGPPGVYNRLATTEVKCNETTEGHVRYDEILREVLYCDGSEWIILLPENIIPGRFELFPALSCQEIHTRQGASATSGVYWIRPMPTLPAFQVYCDLNDTCGDEGGWTLVMKMNGSLDTAEFYSSFWSDKHATKTTSLDLSKEETKLPSYWTLPFTELCLGMANESTRQWISLPVSAASLIDLIEHGDFQATTLGVDVWQLLLPQFSLPAGQACNEGFNVQDDVHRRYVRIGIIASDANCNDIDPSHILGFGINQVGTNAEVTVGGSVPAAGDQAPAFGFILAR